MAFEKSKIGGAVLALGFLFSPYHERVAEYGRQKRINENVGVAEDHGATGLPKEEIYRTYEQFDKNGDKFLDLEEVQKGLEATKSMTSTLEALELRRLQLSEKSESK